MDLIPRPRFSSEEVGFDMQLRSQFWVNHTCWQEYQEVIIPPNGASAPYLVPYLPVHLAPFRYALSVLMFLLPMLLLAYYLLVTDWLLLNVV